MEQLDDAMIFFLASLPQDMFNVVGVIFNKFSKGDLKGQRVVKVKSDSKPLDLKGSNFKCLRGVDYATVGSLLQQVSDGKLTMFELGSQCVAFKQLSKIKSAFVKGTSSGTWEEATEKFPSFTSSEHLQPFKTLNFNSNKLPDEFMKHCRMAITSSTRSKDTTAIELDKLFVLPHNGCSGIIWKSGLIKITPLDFNKLLKSVSTCT